MQQVFLLSCLQAARNKSAPFLFPSSYHIKCIGHTIKVRRAACERFSGLLFAFVKYFRHFSIPPHCRVQKPTMKKNCCVIFQHSAALQDPKNLYEEEPLCYISAFRRSARPKNLYKEGNRCVILQHSAALQSPKTVLSFTAEDFYGEYPHQPDVQARIFGCLQARIIAKRTQRACLAEHIVL